MKAFDIVKGFECALAEYVGSPYCVAVNSGTSALQLAFEYYRSQGGLRVAIPAKTYRSVAAMARRAGLLVMFEDVEWRGTYEIRPSGIWDCALRLAPLMYEPGTVQILSFHPQKPLGLSSGGGAILHDNPDADAYYRLSRFDGRTEGVSIRDDPWPIDGAHCYMFPGQAGEALHKLEVFSAMYPNGLTAAQPKYENLTVKNEARV